MIHLTLFTNLLHSPLSPFSYCIIAFAAVVRRRIWAFGKYLSVDTHSELLLGGGSWQRKACFVCYTRRISPLFHQSWSEIFGIVLGSEQLWLIFDLRLHAEDTQQTKPIDSKFELCNLMNASGASRNSYLL